MDVNKIKVISARLKIELDNIQKLYDILKDRGMFNSKTLKKKLTDDFVLRAVGSIFHDFYTAVENMFRIIAKNIDGFIPSGAEWHLELLEQMCVPIEGTRPAFISAGTKLLLNEFRGFRHVFRNIYGFNLIPERIARLLEIFPETVNSLKRDVEKFVNEMESIIEEK
ncbi:MAG: hypothetical protein XD49_1370 [Caldanaerobacter subterraneus]|uniref:HepT-like domain-containing protein n=3 Tax=Caldanaerobacter subterraneus TaxID=911092 RepID=Q8RBU7_CALS4|nr:MULTISPECIES: hypothetical protein [Caldanaerobacter]AAM23973.1 conserved hypothetical protein [Caldanaerobacter subterraneus subsp. tengcongensis MB4]ERM91292.1 hypothetical protein O163_11165 [Caldanaerobacter subterraneus subsp. yonseiensis KB-1]KUK08587.1 MAG: hypothetical protein XD49_1370 [Caldanaerobacter subterraneus]MCS3916508.1 hypothetical protein [Caldanaerobacter subterraneus subsp. tengcongensis MB4]MDI3517999.1 hypothetical protein [Caldanaerobacter sp.]